MDASEAMKTCGRDSGAIRGTQAAGIEGEFFGMNIVDDAIAYFSWEARAGHGR